MSIVNDSLFIFIFCKIRIYTNYTININLIRIKEHNILAIYLFINVIHYVGNNQILSVSLSCKLNG